VPCCTKAVSLPETGWLLLRNRVGLLAAGLAFAVTTGFYLACSWLVFSVTTGVCCLQQADFKKLSPVASFFLLSMPAALTLRAGRAVQMLKHLCFAKRKKPKKRRPRIARKPAIKSAV
jgi:hypothetical protein